MHYYGNGINPLRVRHINGHASVKEFAADIIGVLDNKGEVDRQMQICFGLSVTLQTLLVVSDPATVYPNRFGL